MSPTSEMSSLPDLRTFIATLFEYHDCVRVAAGKTTNRQQTANNRADAINTFIHVNHGPSSYWGNHKPIDVIVLHKVIQVQIRVASATIRMLAAQPEGTC